MRCALIALLLPLVACASPLRLHAQVASASADLLDAAGAAIEQHAQEDYDRTKAEGGDVAALAKRYAPVERAYGAAKAAWEAYKTAILRAVERGDDRLVQSPLRALLGAWRALAGAGSAVGVDVPSPPPALGDLVGEREKAGGRALAQSDGGVP